MKRENYKNNVWYPLTDETYWAQEYPEEFPYCQTVVAQKAMKGYEVYVDNMMTWETCPYGWGTMAKAENFFFMIIELPHD